MMHFICWLLNGWSKTDKWSETYLVCMFVIKPVLVIVF